MYHLHQYRSERLFDKLDYRDLWLSVRKITKTNNDWNYEELSDENKDNLKIIFQYINEPIDTQDIQLIDSNSGELTVRINENNLHVFIWNYERVRYVHYYDD